MILVLCSFPWLTIHSTLLTGTFVPRMKVSWIINSLDHLFPDLSFPMENKNRSIVPNAVNFGSKLFVKKFKCLCLKPSSASVSFYPFVATHGAYAIATCLPVRQSQSVSVSKWLNVLSKCFQAVRILNGCFMQHLYEKLLVEAHLTIGEH